MRSVSRRHSSPLKRQSRSCPRESLLVWRFDEVKARPFPLLSSRLQDALLSNVHAASSPIPKAPAIDCSTPWEAHSR
jgi:phosphoribulokinase